jgi:hypothetical protein
MSDPCILIVEQDLLVRTPLAEYLRECGYLGSGPIKFLHRVESADS